eukprot:5491502-Prymnesium_polylepis.1
MATSGQQNVSGKKARCWEPVWQSSVDETSRLWRPQHVEMMFLAYSSFVRDAKLLGASGSMIELDIIFKMVNFEETSQLEQAQAQTGSGQKGVQLVDEQNYIHTLNHHEFLEAIVRIAVLRFAPNGGDVDAAEACERCCEHIASNVPRPCGHPPSSNFFRTTFCYIEQTDQALSKHEETLRSIYRVYTDPHGKASLGSQKLTSGEC